MKKIIITKLGVLSLVFVFSALLSFVYLKLSGNGYLVFSDSAKFADIARNLATGAGYHSTFKFFTWLSLSDLNAGILNANGILPAFPLSIFVFFKIFGISDFAVITTSIFFYCTLVSLTFLIGSKLFGKFVGVIAALAVMFDINMLNYAATGSSETIFISLILLAVYFFLTTNKYNTFAGIVCLIFLYFTKFQSSIYIFPIIFFIYSVNFKFKSAVFYFVITTLIILILDKIIFSYTNGYGFFYSMLGQSQSAVFSYSSGSESQSAFLRGGDVSVSIVQLGKKVFYNLYNFYKLLPNILNPYLFSFFLISVLRWKNVNQQVDKFKVVVLLMSGSTLLVAAITIPFFRYIHPIIPFVYILGIESLVWVIYKVSSNTYLFRTICVFLTAFFIVGQTVGVIFLDSRFTQKKFNAGKPPVYAELSKILENNTIKSHVVLTNLDTWGSWYGERKTVWFPIEPKQIIDTDNKIPFDAIYLTSYLMNDENYKMGESWRLIYDNPLNPEKWTCGGCDVIAKEFILKGVYNVKPDENYERQDARAVLLIKK